MPRPNPADPKEGQDALFGPSPAPKPNAGGKMSGGLPEGDATTAMRRSLAFAQTEGGHTPMDEGSGEVLIAYARAVDGAVKHGTPYVLGKIGQPLVDLLGAMHMTPDSRDDTAGTEAIAALVAELGATEPVHEDG
ncbi:hypothetical protein [Gordonia sp. CPCC 205333]|uniref:hypothetical protein n=1 Tax=Gordonia sp. CPCC 205333 TaxID=3140790 RepID=UPI003AF37050